MIISHKVRNIHKAITVRLFFEFSCNILQYLIFQSVNINIYTTMFLATEINLLFIICLFKFEDTTYIGLKTILIVFVICYS